ncbi:transposase, IS481 family [Bordetella pertussis H921]|nr:transposase, IS481 family [Bordetella pertussis H921]
MNTHKHARLTFLRRLEMVQQLIAHQVCVPEAARAYGVTAPTVRKWLGRFLAQGQAGLADASSRPTVSPRAIAPAKALAIVELRRKRLTQARIAQALGVSASTVSRVLARAGLSHLADLEPAEPVVRYEHQAPGDLLHIDIKKLGRIQRPGHRVTGNRRDTVEGAGWDFVFVAIDDHARVAFTDIHPDERFPSAVQFLKDAVAYYQRLGVTIQRLLTDNGSAFRSRAFAALCHELGIKHRFTRPYRPQTNGKAERFIQSALREWAYAHTYQNSQHRADAMKSWLHHYNSWLGPLRRRIVASTPPRHRARCTHLQTQPGRIQPIDSSHLAGQPAQGQASRQQGHDGGDQAVEHAPGARAGKQRREQARPHSQDRQPDHAGGQRAGGERQPGIGEAVRQRPHHHHVQPEVRIEQGEADRAQQRGAARGDGLAGDFQPAVRAQRAARGLQRIPGQEGHAEPQDGLDQPGEPARERLQPPDAAEDEDSVDQGAHGQDAQQVRAHQPLAQDEGALRADDGKQPQAGGGATGPGGDIGGYGQSEHGGDSGFYCGANRRPASGRRMPFSLAVKMKYS